MVFGLAAIITYYKGGTRADGAPIEPDDAPEIMQLLKDLWATGDTQKVAEGVLAAENIWKENLNQTVPGLTELDGKHAIFFIFSSDTKEKSLCTLEDFAFSF